MENNTGINYAHVNALLKAADQKYKYTVDGQQLVTQGHFILAYDGKMDLSEFKEMDGGSIWKKLQSDFSTVSSGSHGKTHLETSDSSHVRIAHGVVFREAFARCFPGAVFFKANSLDKKYGIGVVVDKKLVAGIMGMQRTETSPLPVEATDAEAFAPFACEANNYYLTEDDGLSQRVADLEGELEDVHESLRVAEGKMNECAEIIKEIESNIESLRKERAARHATEQPNA